jgi:hypothetical protein
MRVYRSWLRFCRIAGVVIVCAIPAAVFGAGPGWTTSMMMHAPAG